jgi:hypothetical protein
MPVTAEVRLSVSGSHSNALDLGTAALPFSLSATASLLSGVLAGMVDRVFTDTRTLIASATEDLDLAGVLVDAFGAVITMAKLKGLIIKAAAANTNNVNLSRPAGATGVPLFLAVGDGIAIPPGYAFAWFGSGLAGIPVTPGTGDLITLTNGAGGTPVSYDVVILGTSA